MKLKKSKKGIWANSNPEKAPEKNDTGSVLKGVDTIDIEGGNDQPEEPYGFEEAVQETMDGINFIMKKHELTRNQAIEVAKIAKSLEMVNAHSGVFEDMFNLANNL